VPDEAKCQRTAKPSTSPISSWTLRRASPATRSHRNTAGTTISHSAASSAVMPSPTRRPRATSKTPAAEAYEAKRKYLQNAWRKNDHDAADNDALLPTQDARAVADPAWLEKKERLQNSWRMK
jgi:hypothetical protein